jgi:hypothetical protein
VIATGKIEIHRLMPESTIGKPADVGAFSVRHAVKVSTKSKPPKE